MKNYAENYSIGLSTSFRSGGACRYFHEPHNLAELNDFLKFANDRNLPVFVFGEGTNILVSDSGVLACVVGLKHGFSKIQVDENRIVAGAGARFLDLIKICIENGLSGLEDCYGIPGTIGGALCGNAGVPNCCIGNVVESVDILGNDGQVHKLDNEQCNFSYRNSGLQDKIVLGCTLKFDIADKNEVLARANVAIEKRKTQPKGRTAGSVFKNPDSHSAGFMLDKAGLKGLRKKTAVYSDIHANFIVNEGTSSYEIFELIQLGKNKVHEKFGIVLENEIKLWGFPSNFQDVDSREAREK